MASFLAALVILLLPGLPLVLGVRMPALDRLAILPAASILVVSLTAELGRVLGIPWSPASPLGLALLLGILLVLRSRAELRSRRAGGGEGSEHRREPLVLAAVLGGAVLGAGTILARGLAMMGEVGAVSQTYDAVFHLNAVRWILDTGDASAWSVGSMTALPGEGTFYPAAWHQLASLVTMLSGGDVVLSSNALLLTAAALIWPLGMMAIVHRTTSTGPVGILLAGGLSGVAGAFPLQLMAWGLVLPNLLSTLLLPAFLLLAAHALGLVPREEERISGAGLAVLLPVVAIAIVLAHPQGMFAALLLAIPAAAGAVLAHRRGPVLLRRRAAAILAAGILLALITWPLLSPASSATWLPTTDQSGAFLQALSLAGNEVPAVPVLGLAVAAAAAGLILRREARWILPAFALPAAVFMVAASVWDPALRSAITGPWYSDPYRVAAIPVVTGIPLLAAGLAALVLALPRPAPRWRPVIALGVTAAILPTALLSPSGRSAQSLAAGRWQASVLLTPDEKELLEILPEHVPEGSVIAVNPWNGGALAYAVSDREVLSRFMGFQAPDEVHLLNASLDEAQEDPEVCTAAHELGVDYALDFGPQELMGREATYVGLNEISTSGAAVVVAEVGDARLLRLLPCRGEDGSMLA